MTFLWLVIGFVIGVLVAWWYLNRQHKKLADDLTNARRQAEEDLRTERSAHEDTKRQLVDSRASGEEASKSPQAQTSELEQRMSEKDAEISRLQSELASAKAPTAHSQVVVTSEHLPAAVPDDLTKIKGIGVVLQGKLHDLGVLTFQQIADLTPEDIEHINGVLDFPGRIEREKWVEQAKAIVAN
ncbi:MAG: hypothetical protein ACTSYE_08690 [Alphaproteobacteria bacterium]